ncbi:Retrovirus-related Pol polyprotein from transposon TNT 1-94 [Vitis vinifera]|uniref:Retrovirus-related Pol polyprotein from transposon TNT 1-94 n=1 Tax=Vitis vinifera TaxID=29760 RepID=A0A438D8Q9_VITVI|nr:Retrovirus-related Pol polyprotein from transposon TNT 1-94 [Vitis vinifera]
MEKLRSLLGSLDKPTRTCSLALSGTLSLSFCINASHRVYDDSWIIDSGAIDHRTSKSQLFYTYTPSLSNKKIVVANGSLATVAGFRDIYITPTLILKNVLHVPKLNKAWGGGLDLLRKGTGILHDSSCVNTPQKNGVAKKKNGHYSTQPEPYSFKGMFLDVTFIENKPFFPKSSLQGEISMMEDSPCESFEPLDLPHVSTHGDEEPESFESITPESPNFITEPMSSLVPASETFAQVAKMNTVRILLSLATHYNQQLLQYDVKNAFLHGDLDEEIYMNIPPGFEGNMGNKVCKLKKTLYKLKQSPRAWFGRFAKVMTDFGYKQNQDIAYLVSVINQFMHDSREPHFQVAYRMLHYLKGNPGKGILFKKNNTLALEAYTDVDFVGSFAKSEFRAIAQGLCELLWLKIILDDLRIKWDGLMKLYCDNKSAINIAHDPIQHDRTKYIEIDRHFIKEKSEDGIVSGNGRHLFLSLRGSVEL